MHDDSRFMHKGMWPAFHLMAWSAACPRAEKLQHHAVVIVPRAFSRMREALMAGHMVCTSESVQVQNSSVVKRKERLLGTRGFEGLRDVRRDRVKRSFFLLNTQCYLAIDPIGAMFSVR